MQVEEGNPVKNERRGRLSKMKDLETIWIIGIQLILQQQPI
jgi:hypothetical protein